MQTCRFCKGDGFVMSSRGDKSAPCPFCKGTKKTKAPKGNCVKCGSETTSVNSRYCRDC